MTKRALAILVLALSTLAGAAIAQTQAATVTAGEGKATASQVVQATAKIVAIDAKTRTVTLQNDQGEKTDVVCGDDVRNFDQLKVGDEVTFQYYESLTLKLDKVTGGEAMVSEKTSELRSEPGELPGGVKTRETTITAKVTAVDTAKNTVTIVGPKGNSHTLEVEPDMIGKVAVGDLVHAIYTEAVAISVSRVTVK
jgi:Cu/Ag efflux protein CusF